MIRGDRLLLALDFIRYLDELDMRGIGGITTIKNPRAFSEIKARAVLENTGCSIEKICTSYSDPRERARVYLLPLLIFLEENASLLATPGQEFSVANLLAGITGFFVREPLEQLFRFFASGQVTEADLKEFGPAANA